MPCGDVLYYPSAFTTAALDIIHEHVAPAQRILLNRVDATRFAANAVCFDRALILSSCSDALRRALEERGYTVAESRLHTFLRSGGAACCLTLRLDHQTKPEQASFVGSAHGDTFQSTAALPESAISNANNSESRPGATAQASQGG